MVSLTNAVDVADLLKSCTESENAIPGVYNCGSGKVYSYNEVASMCGKVANMDAHIVNYNADVKGKGEFPFRPNNFHVVPTKAKEGWGWEGGNMDLEGDLKWYYDDFLKRGGGGGGFEKDEEILAVEA